MGPMLIFRVFYYGDTLIKIRILSLEFCSVNELTHLSQNGLKIHYPARYHHTGLFGGKKDRKWDEKNHSAGRQFEFRTREVLSPSHVLDGCIGYAGVTTKNRQLERDHTESRDVFQYCSTSRFINENAKIQTAIICTCVSPWSSLTSD